jgi:hypothetical protein
MDQGRTLPVREPCWPSKLTGGCSRLQIENLDDFTGLRAIWLESNGLTKIEGFTHNTELRCM